MQHSKSNEGCSCEDLSMRSPLLDVRDAHLSSNSRVVWPYNYQRGRNVGTLRRDVHASWCNVHTHGLYAETLHDNKAPETADTARCVCLDPQALAFYHSFRR